MGEKTAKTVQDEMDVTMDLVDARVDYVSLVHTSSNPEAVILEFCQEMPSFGDEGTKKRIRLAYRCAMTWPHVARTERLLRNLLNRHRDDALKALEDAFSDGESAVPVSGEPVRDEAR